MGHNKTVLLYTILFILFLYPFSISLSNEDGASANYLFLTFPLFVGAYNRKFNKPKSFWLISITIFTLIFLVATLYQFNYIQFIIRRLISFILFMSIFSFIFIKVDKNMIIAFKYSIIVVSFLFSIITLYKFIALGASDLGFDAKGEVGSQRYGFVYVLTLWVLFFEENIIKIIKIFLISVIVIGLLLTFSRSGIVAMIVSMLLFTILSTIIINLFRSNNFYWNNYNLNFSFIINFY